MELNTSELDILDSSLSSYNRNENGNTTLETSQLIVLDDDSFEMSKNDDFSIVLTPSKLNETGELLILDDYEESFQTTDEDDYLVCSDTVKKENKKACSDNAQSGREFTTKITTGEFMIYTTTLS